MSNWDGLDVKLKSKVIKDYGKLGVYLLDIWLVKEFPNIVVKYIRK